MSRRVAPVVLHSCPGPSDDASYIDQVVHGNYGVTHHFFSWREAITARYDIFHVHWPEGLLSKGGPAGLLRPVLLSLLLLRLWITRTPIVRTVHNVVPHEGRTAVQHALYCWLDALTSVFVVLNPYTPTPAHRQRVLIPHGEYLLPFADHPRSAPVKDRFLFFGMLRPYKGVEGLISVFRSSGEARQLRIIGRPKGGFADLLAGAAQGDARISLRMQHVSDRVLVDEVSRATVVVLPYKTMHNSGALFAALSVGRHVLAPNCDVNRWVAEEVGPRWLTLYEGEIATSDLSTALGAAAVIYDSGAQGPRFVDRDWNHVSARYADVYRACVSRSSPSRSNTMAPPPAVL